MHIPAKVDYGLRALLLTLGRYWRAADGRGHRGGPGSAASVLWVPSWRICDAPDWSPADGGPTAATASPAPPEEITVAEVIRALDGPLAEVRGCVRRRRSTRVRRSTSRQVWVAVRASLRSVLEQVTLAGGRTGKLPRHLSRSTSVPDAWEPHGVKW